MKIRSSSSVVSMTLDARPVARVDSGETLVFETYDCFSNQITSEDQVLGTLDWNIINPATGPVYIEDAKPGDILKVEILDIEIGDKGVFLTGPDLGTLGHIIKEEKIKIVDIKDGKVIFNEKIHIPIEPMIGVIGTAPQGEGIPTGTPGDHGGNMDCKRITKGSTLYLPVNVDGALLAIGDLHAVMGDGEVAVCGVETPGEVTVKVTVLKDIELPLPMLIDGERMMTIASAKTLDEASVLATENMHKILTDIVGMDVNEAVMLLSAIGDLRICQIVDPLMTVRMELPLWVLEEYDYPTL